MNTKLKILHIFLCFLPWLPASVATAQQIGPIGQTSHFIFYSHPRLNEHLFLYGQAVKLKAAKTADDSLLNLIEGSVSSRLTLPEKQLLSGTFRYYLDSVIGKDLLFDNDMRALSDRIISDSGMNVASAGVQQSTLMHLDELDPLFKKYFWQKQDSLNRQWLSVVNTNVAAMESNILQDLQHAFHDSLPAKKIRVDISTYATWAGAYTYNEYFPHIIISSTDKFNQQYLGTEVVFHEASHLLIDKLNKAIMKAAAGKTVKRNINLWHNLIFYTTGYLLKQAYQARGIAYVAFYKELNFEARIPGFKLTVDAFDSFWIPHLKGKVDLDTAISNIVTYVIENDK